MISINYEYLNIEYSTPEHTLNHTLKFKLRNNSVVPKWVKKIIDAQFQGYQIDEPGRFYGFNSYEVEKQNAIVRVNRCIDLIDSHANLIGRHLKDVNEQEFLNDLHFMFEQYHGLLDNQTHELFLTASPEVKQAFADLNINIHRCESVQRGSMARHVITYYGLPKTDFLDTSDYCLFENNYKFGTVYLNYVEIGKTLEDLAVDNDKHIYDQEFQPFRRYSADFAVYFANSDQNWVLEKQEKIKKYYYQHKDFFLSKNLQFDHYLLKPGRIPVADLEVDISDEDVLELIRQRQFVKSVYFS